MKAPALKLGDTITFVSPSERLNNAFPIAHDRAKSFFERLRYKVNVIFDDSPAANFRDNVLRRCEEIHAAFRDIKVKMVLRTAGGTTANELLRFLDYDLIRANPQVFCGYSDITVSHYAICLQSVLQTFYGSTALTEFGEYPEPLEFTAKHFFHVFQGAKAQPIGPVPRSLKWTQDLLDFFRDDKSEQRRGTGYAVAKQQAVYLVDASDLANMTLFDELAGLVIGRPFAYSGKLLEDFNQTVLDQCWGTEYPILTNVDIGHTGPMLTIPLDSMAMLDSENDDFSILESGVLDD
ncbi:uncharacterized protein PAC_04349 [Phialocephala subalpina]|uniref:LD-carboxypeptidase n=1 Tax=Phialocephala subalpina TaxID=576137 RepID=A0A1L7WNW4_9HELO|nr:uncharacterized protein PAC_04349 [Phialocephala subalpina]